MVTQMASLARLARKPAYSRFVEYPVGRILRDARLYAVGAGTQEIRRMLIGREFNNIFAKSR